MYFIYHFVRTCLETAPCDCNTYSKIIAFLLISWTRFDLQNLRPHNLCDIRLVCYCWWQTHFWWVELLFSFFFSFRFMETFFNYVQPALWKYKLPSIRTTEAPGREALFGASLTIIMVIIHIHNTSFQMIDLQCTFLSYNGITPHCWLK